LAILKAAVDIRIARNPNGPLGGNRNANEAGLIAMENEHHPLVDVRRVHPGAKISQPDTPREDGDEEKSVDFQLAVGEQDAIGSTRHEKLQEAAIGILKMVPLDQLDDAEFELRQFLNGYASKYLRN
jgi:hypothetical protein